MAGSNSNVTVGIQAAHYRQCVWSWQRGAHCRVSRFFNGVITDTAAGGGRACICCAREACVTETGIAGTTRIGCDSAAATSSGREGAIGFADDIPCCCGGGGADVTIHVDAWCGCEGAIDCATTLCACDGAILLALNTTTVVCVCACACGSNPTACGCEVEGGGGGGLGCDEGNSGIAADLFE